MVVRERSLMGGLAPVEITVGYPLPTNALMRVLSSDRQCPLYKQDTGNENREAPLFVEAAARSQFYPIDDPIDTFLPTFANKYTLGESAPVFNQQLHAVILKL